MPGGIVEGLTAAPGIPSYDYQAQGAEFRGAVWRVRKAFNRTGSSASTGLAAQLHIPVGQIEEVLPVIVHGPTETDLNEGTPLRPFWFADQP